jgi:hypothetical protein
VQPNQTMSKGTIIGKCKLCLDTKELNFEHIPPRSAFNKETKYYIVDQTEYYQKAKEYTFDNLKPKSRKEQGGIGKFSFCILSNVFFTPCFYWRSGGFNFSHFSKLAICF